MKFIFKCLNHVEDTPSMSVNIKTDEYYCFSCGSNGTVSESTMISGMVLNHLQNMINHLQELYHGSQKNQ